MQSYHFVSQWVVAASPAEVYRLLEDIPALSRWWPSVYLDVRVLRPGRAGGVGKVVALYTKGWLPYTLHWQFRVTEADFPHGFRLEARGDLDGEGTWTFRALGDVFTAVRYDWRIRAEKPLLRWLSPLLRPLFAANHHWAMRRGEQSLRLELQRQRAATTAERLGIPEPPGPTFPHRSGGHRFKQQPISLFP